MTVITVFRTVLALASIVFIPLFFVLADPWLPLIGVTCLLYLVYMFFFSWDEPGVSYLAKVKK